MKDFVGDVERREILVDGAQSVILALKNSFLGFP